MTTQTQKSFWGEALSIYDNWASPLIVYLVVFLFSLGASLLLDFKFGLSPGRVLSFVVPLTVLLLLAVPALFLAIRRWKADPQAAPDNRVSEKIGRVRVLHDEG